MLVRMAKEKKQPEVKPKVEVPAKEPKKHYFNRKQILFSAILIAVGIIDVLEIYNLPRLVFDSLIILAGLWLLKLGVGSGYYKKRKEVFKKYI